MKNPIQTFEANTKGRDFCIGDLHGMYDTFQNLLTNLNFDPEVDRMFSVGDLVDRGPDSAKCLELLAKPWFNSVLANHEQMMYEAFYGGYMGEFWMQNGGMWGLPYLQEFIDEKINVSQGIESVMSKEARDFLTLIDVVGELPFLITVNLANGKKVHIIHAELPPAPDTGSLTDEDLADPATIRRLASVQSRDGDFLVWGRFKFYRFYLEDLSNIPKVTRTVRNLYHPVGGRPGDNISHILSGHTPVQRPLEIFGQTNIDTGVFLSTPSKYGSGRSWAGLTCVDLNAWKFYQATDTTFKEVECLVINTDEQSGDDDDTENS